MDKKKIFITLIIIIIVFVSLGFWFFISQKNTPSSEEIVKNFAYLFGTFDYKNPEEYIKKLEPFIDPEYLNTFKEKFSLPPKERIEKEGWEENYSRVENIKRIEKKQENKTSVLFYIEMEVFKKDIRFPEPEFKDTIILQVSVIKKGNRWYISDVQFAPEIPSL